MEYVALIIICSAGTPQINCQVGAPERLYYIAAPERSYGLAGCMRYGMMYAAESGLVSEGQVVKVRCRPHDATTTTRADLPGENPALQVGKSVAPIHPGKDDDAHK